MAAHPNVERLESRGLLALSGLTVPVVAQVEVEPNDTLDRAQPLGDLSTQPSAAAVGSIGNSPAGAADVDWYQFTLDAPAHVTLDLGPRGSGHPLAGVLSLYNDDPFDFQDNYDPTGHRLLVQSVGSSGADARIERDLGPGTYEVAISGGGNLEFNPFLAGSGYAGSIGDYDLQLVATALTVGPNDGPAVLTSDPAPGAVLAASPFVIRLDFGSALDPSTVIPDQTVRLISNPGGTFGDGHDQDVPLAWVNVGVNGTELQLAPAAPLAPGFYQVVLAGDSSVTTPEVADLNGNPLGASATTPGGRDYTATFQINGIEGQTGSHAASDEVLANAHDLGDLTAASNIVSIAGAIGDDPYYDNSDVAHAPANDVDLYHFHISGPGRYAVVAEVFAGRIGSPLDPGVSLFRVNPADGTLQFLAGNNNSLNPVQGTDGSAPLFLDALLTHGLTAGDYYLAVSSSFNTPSPAELEPVGDPGVFDPNTPHSGQNGYSTGPYVLNVLVHPTPAPPQVVATNPAEGATFDQPPTQLTVQFDEPVNLQQLAFLKYLATNDCTLPSVFIQGTDGTTYHPQFQSYDPATNQVTFAMLDRLPAGSYALHLSGPGGLADLGGNPLVGNDPSGDYVVHFQVNAADPVHPDASGKGGQIDAQLGPDGTANLGVLFPNELHAGLTLVHTPAHDAGPAAGGGITNSGQEYQFTLLQDQNYVLTLQGPNLPQGAGITLRGTTGHAVRLMSLNAGTTLFGELLPGTYEVSVAGVTSDTSYQVQFAVNGDNGYPVSLLSGPVPALQLRFDGSASGGSSSTGGGSSADVPVAPGAPSTTGGGSTSTPSNPSGSGGNGVVPGPTSTTSSGTSSTSTAPGNVGAVQAAPVVTVNLPPPGPDIPPASTGPVGGPTSGVTPISTEVTAIEHVAGGVTTVENLVSADLAVLGVGPVGGVQPTGVAVAVSGPQVVQVSLPTPGNTPIPTGLVSLVTLTRAGELGDPAQALAGPVDHDELAVDGANAAQWPLAAADAVPAAVDRVGAALEQLAAWWPRPSTRPRDVTAADDASDSWDAPADPVDTDRPLALAEDQGAVGIEGGLIAEGGGFDDASVLANAPGPWFFLMALLGTVTVYARKRRLARRTATSGRSGVGAHPMRGLFRIWILQAARTRPDEVRTWRAGVPRPNLAPRPRHLTNPLRARDPR